MVNIYWKMKKKYYSLKERVLDYNYWQKCGNKFEMQITLILGFYLCIVSHLTACQ